MHKFTFEVEVRATRTVAGKVATVSEHHFVIVNARNERAAWGKMRAKLEENVKGIAILVSAKLI